jgi:hypothetical protein
MTLSAAVQSRQRHARSAADTARPVPDRLRVILSGAGRRGGRPFFDPATRMPVMEGRVAGGADRGRI